MGLEAQDGSDVVARYGGLEAFVCSIEGLY